MLRHACRRERVAHIDALVGFDAALAASSLVAGAFALAGTLIGGAIAGIASYKVAQQAREAAERSWIRDTRREIYDRFLTRAQDLQSTCQHYQAGAHDGPSGDALERAFNDFFQAYGVVQTVAERRVVAAARVHGYRLHELRDQVVGKPGKLDPPDTKRVDELVRTARHETVAAMREELGLPIVEPVSADFNAFVGTDLEHRHVSKRVRSGVG